MKCTGCITLLLLSSASLVGCPATTPPAAFPQRSADCPERPDAMSRIEEIEQLGRSARETRANLITQWPKEGAAEERIVATLHDPHLSLIESILQTPRRARRPDDAWLKRHLLRASIELRAAKPIEALERGDRRALRLSTESGSQLPIILISRQRDGKSWLYRLSYDAPLIDRALIRLKLELPLGSGKRDATFDWALSRRNLDRLDRLPVAYGLASLRDLVWARKAALYGDLAPARQLAARVSSCEPKSQAAHLLRALQRQDKTRSKSFDFGASDEPGVNDSGARPIAAALTLRAALLARLAPSARRGLLPAAGYRALLEELRKAAPRPKPEALLSFDRALAAMLEGALAPYGPIAAPAPELEALAPTAAPTEKDVSRELALRLALATHQLRPGLIDAPEPAFDAPRLLIISKESEEKSLFAAQLYRRVGTRWLHLGLPGGRAVTRRLIAPPSSYWRRWAHGAKDRAALRALARKVLASALIGSEGPLVRAAARTLSAGRVEELLKLAKDEPKRLAPLLCGLPTSAATKQRALLRGYARHASNKVRGAAMIALGRAGESNTLRASLRDGAPVVSAAALVALLHQSDGLATKLLPRVLAHPGKGRRHLLAALERHAVLPPLARRQHGSLERNLLQLYRRDPALRSDLLRLATKLRLVRLLSLGFEERDLSLRRLAAAGLAATNSTKSKTLNGIARDPDAEIALSGTLGLARLRDAGALLSLGAKARQGCVTPALVIPVLAPSMDKRSLKGLFVESLRSPCPELAEQIWPLVAKYFARDIELQRAGLGHQRGKVRVLAAITTLGH